MATRPEFALSDLERVAAICRRVEEEERSETSHWDETRCFVSRTPKGEAEVFVSVAKSLRARDVLERAAMGWDVD